MTLATDRSPARARLVHSAIMTLEACRPNDFGHLPPTLRIGDLEVNRLGFGAIALAGKDAFGEPEDAAKVKAVLRRAVELGIDFLDTAGYYGPRVSNRLICEALHPYPEHLVIATKLGMRRGANKSWVPALRPTELRADCEENLRALKVERLDLVQLRYFEGGEVSFDEALGAAVMLQRQGKIRHLGLANAPPNVIEEVAGKAPIVAVQNFYNVLGGKGWFAKATHSEDAFPEMAVDVCTARGIAFMPFIPASMPELAAHRPTLDRIAEAHGATPAQVLTAWLLARSPVMLPVPAPSSVEQVEEVWAARTLTLSAADYADIAPSPI